MLEDVIDLLIHTYLHIYSTEATLAAFYSLGGRGSGICISDDITWKFTNVMQFWANVRLESFRHDQHLLTLLTKNNAGVDILFNGNVLTVVVQSPKGVKSVVSSSPVTFQTKKWYHIMILHTKRAFGNDELTITANGKEIVISEGDEGRTSNTLHWVRRLRSVRTSGISSRYCKLPRNAESGS